MNKYYIRYHIKGGNRVISKEVKGYEIHEVMSEVIYDLDHKKRILFGQGTERIYGINVDAISHFEILTEKQNELLNKMSLFSGGAK